MLLKKLLSIKYIILFYLTLHCISDLLKTDIHSSLS